MITVHRAGALSLIEDLGRPGYASLGVSGSGAADRGAIRTANRLVGNDENAAAIEVTLGGLKISSDRPVWCAVTGPATDIFLDGREVSVHSSFHLPTGASLRISSPAAGLRNYLAVRGGINVSPVLGSRSGDLLSGLGPGALEPGDQLEVGRPTSPLPDIGFVPDPTRPAGLPLTGELTLTPGPRRDWFTPAAFTALTQHSWTVTGDADRTAIRLNGPELTRRSVGELPSEALLRGAIQVPTSGQPLIFLADHPVTGGYPVIAVLTEQSCDLAAQLRPGDTFRLLNQSAATTAGCVQTASNV